MCGVFIGRAKIHGRTDPFEGAFLLVALRYMDGRTDPSEKPDRAVTVIFDTMSKELVWDSSSVFVSASPFRVGVAFIPVLNCVAGSKLRRAGAGGISLPD